MGNSPTDAELDMLIDDVAGLDSSNEAFRKFARAVLAKWGTPAPTRAGEVVAWVDERAIGWLKNSRAHSATITTTLGKAKSSERPMPLHGTPQSTQPQAGAVPMTEQAIEAMWSDHWDGFVTFAEAEVVVRAIEKAHGIKGGQHGTKT